MLITATDSKNKVVGTATSDTSGSYTIAGLAAGSYTLTPSYTSTGTVIFAPVSYPVTLTTSNVSVSNFNLSVSFSVSGTINYSGSKTGRIYISLSSTSCGGSSPLGTSIAAAGPYTIRGVTAGPVTISAWMDTLGQGKPNANNPSGSNSSLTVATANLTGADITLTDPAAVTLNTAPTLDGAFGFNSSALVMYEPLKDSNKVEQATSYTLQWATDAGFTTGTGSETFPANGAGGANIWFVNGLTDGTAYYFRFSGTAGSSTSPESAAVGPVTIGASTGVDTVSGKVTFTGSASGPLYAGCFDQAAGKFYGDYIANPVSPQAYSVQVPANTNCGSVAVLDQNHDGVINTGDPNNTGGNLSVTTITGNTTLDITLSGANAVATVTTQDFRFEDSSNSNNTLTTMGLNLKVLGNLKLSVAVYLASGPSIAPTDRGVCSSNCGGEGGFQFFSNVPVTPSAGDTYTFQVTYSDGTSETLTAKVTDFIPPSDLPTNIAATASLTPDFSWTDPVDGVNYLYQFVVADSNNNNIWQIPGDNSNSVGFPSTITQIVWGTDPTGGGSTPTGALSAATQYVIVLTLTDSHGNTGVKSVTFTTP